MNLFDLGKSNYMVKFWEFDGNYFSTLYNIAIDLQAYPLAAKTLLTMSFVPVIVGVADIKNKTDEHKEPATLMLEAITSAITDTSAPPEKLKSSIDSIDIVRTWTWPYADLPGLLSKRLGLKTRPKWTRYTETHGGNQPAKLVDEAAARIAGGEATIAVVTGGEALASREYIARGPRPPVPGH